MKEKKSILQWVRELLRLKAPELTAFPDPPSEQVVTSLVRKAADNLPIPSLMSKDSDLPDDSENSSQTDETNKADSPDKKKKESCPYAVKRNLVESLREIRKFAEENNLASTMVRALLTLLAEMALGALRGKVNASVLDSLLKIFSFETAIAEAYTRGEQAGKDAAIEKEYFPAVAEEVPHLRGLTTARGESNEIPEIFRIARES